MEIFVFFVITFELIKIQTCSAPQNDLLNVSFVKDTYIDARKVGRNGSKTAIYLSQILSNILFIFWTMELLRFTDL